MNCPNCQQQIPDTANVCGYCGQRQPQKQNCPQCGTELPPQVKVCGHCGQRLEAGPPVPIPPSVPPPIKPQPPPVAMPTPPQAEAIPSVEDYPAPTRKIPIWVWVTGGLIVICILAGGVLGGGLIWSQSQKRATQTAQAQALATASVQAEATKSAWQVANSTATAEVQATATAEVQATITAEAEQAARETATAQVRGTATAQVQETATAEAEKIVKATATAKAWSTAMYQTEQTATAQAQRTATAQTRRTATAQAQQAIKTTATARAQVIDTITVGVPLFGPDSGTLVHDEEDDYTETKGAGVEVSDFVVEAIFPNPYPAVKDSWDIGFAFRVINGDSLGFFWLVVKSNGDWKFWDHRDGKNHIIDESSVSNLDVSDGASNRLKLISKGGQGFFFLNDNFIAELDLSGRTDAGSISILVGFSNDDGLDEQSAAYEDFTVWALTDGAGAAAAAPTKAAPTLAPTPVPTQVALPPASKPAQVGQIAFVSNRDGNYELYLMNADGSSQQRLTNTPDVTEWLPAWSPDGSRIVFECMVDSSANVCLINADGSGYTQITDWPEGDYKAHRAVWSPDGQKIAVGGNKGGSENAIIVMNANGSDQTNIAEGSYPYWSPDGSQIVFITWEGGNWQIKAVNFDGSNVRILNQGEDDRLYPTWSPDGRQIAFDFDRSKIAVIDATGGTERIIAAKTSFNLSWSSDSQQILIAPYGGLWVVNVDGSGISQISQDGAQPAWYIGR